MSDETEVPEEQPEAEPKRKPKKARASEDAPAAPEAAKVKVRVTRSAVHDGLGGKFYQGDEPEVAQDVADVWIERGWAEPL